MNWFTLTARDCIDIVFALINSPIPFSIRNNALSSTFNLTALLYRNVG